MKDYFGYQGKKVVITGAASGMGAAATEMLLDLGAEIYALDVRPVPFPVKQYIAVDLLKRDSIDAAIAKLPAKIDCIFNCAGIPGARYKGGSFTEADVVMVNFAAARYLIEKLVARMPKGGAIAIISSTGGSTWRDCIPTIMPLIETKTFEEARAWLEAHKDDEATIAFPGGGYMTSKQAIILYAKLRAAEFATTRGIRINTLSPGTTESGMTSAFVDMYGEEALKAGITVGRYATSAEQAEPLVFLNSNMARYVSGVDFQVDFGAVANLECGGSLPPLEG